MLGSGSAGNSALVATDHCKILVDGGLSARQLVLRLAQCGVTPAQVDGVLLTHEHTDQICGLEVPLALRSVAPSASRPAVLYCLRKQCLASTIVAR
jgi:metal-dependent hydrolase (beta-lactamase superfamily II)